MKFEVTGPREHIYFPTVKTKAGIATRSGLWPGLNSTTKGTKHTKAMNGGWLESNAFLFVFFVPSWFKLRLHPFAVPIEPPRAPAAVDIAPVRPDAARPFT